MLSLILSPVRILMAGFTALVITVSSLAYVKNVERVPALVEAPPVYFHCAQGRSFIFTPHTGSATIELSDGRVMEVFATETEEGVRYLDKDEVGEFTVHGDSAGFISHGLEDFSDCVREDTPTASTCVLSLKAPATAYVRPSNNAAVFGTIAIDEKSPVVGRTTTGWIGVEPGVPQAPNIGPFRARWVQLDEQTALEGATCSVLPIMPALDADACYVMVHQDTAVYAQPIRAAVTVATLYGGAYVRALSRDAVDPNFLRVNLTDGSSGIGRTGKTVGWVHGADVDLNGECPAVEAQ
ncbi:MAG: hypothetical protein KBE09_03880 [Candidatus Pacebacteria bacterium]|nr:hypothetical protein [Candidatus Paceibacterota bacterium]